jgi:general secretion pathway protein G
MLGEITLIKILIVIAVMSIAVAILIPEYIGGHPRVKELGDTASLAWALEAYRVDHGTYPPNEAGLRTLFAEPGIEGMSGPYLSGSYEDFVDRWERPYVYSFSELYGIINVYSLGLDGIPMTEDDLGMEINVETGSRTTMGLEWLRKMRSSR